jgi:excisionase family DNA binding protein
MPAITSDDPRTFLSVGEAAIRLGVSGPTVRRWVKGGHLAAAQPAGREGLILIPAAELERLAEGTH